MLKPYTTIQVLHDKTNMMINYSSQIIKVIQYIQQILLPLQLEPSKLCLLTLKICV